MNDLFVRFQGFHPSSFTRSYLNTVLARLIKAAPSGATLDAFFYRRNKVFKGTISIHSSCGQFFATASGRRVKEVTRKIMDQLKKQIKKKQVLMRESYDKDVMA